MVRFVYNDKVLIIPYFLKAEGDVVDGWIEWEAVQAHLQSISTSQSMYESICSLNEEL